MTGPTTAVVVVAFRSAPHLAAGLPALLGDPSVGDVVVVDNSSDPATAAAVAAAGDRVRYVDPGANLGFARGCNLGMRLTADPVVAFVNPDVLLVRPLTDLVRACADGDAAVLGGGLTETPDGEVLGNARRRVTLVHELGRAVLGSRVSELPVPVGAGTRAVDQVDGALLVARRDVLEALGGFDERFELYFEDVDICDRARAVGGVLLDTRRFGVHAGGSSARTVAGTSYCVFRTSRVRYLRKRYGTAGAVAGLAITAAETLARAVTRQPEGGLVRRRALAMVLREVLRPGRAQVLPARPAPRRAPAAAQGGAEA
ncbi:glycosyltransferase family 2 protein [Modestobacter sp. NPDC049651]|uniref:glycosyltransferase family 2 protein n=1 Tax=unclassified Modestobacter TaxID=2643866 RepID=UPI0033FDEE0F